MKTMSLEDKIEQTKANLQILIDYQNKKIIQFFSFVLFFIAIFGVVFLLNETGVYKVSAPSLAYFIISSFIGCLFYLGAKFLFYPETILASLKLFSIIKEQEKSIKELDNYLKASKTKASSLGNLNYGNS
jgi:hypothetical protein